MTTRADALVADLEAACWRMNDAEGLKAVSDAYTQLCDARRELFSYLQHLEGSAELIGAEYVQRRF